MKIATQLVQRARGLHNAHPITTPIYETTTFVFDSAQEVRDFNEGRSDKFLYSRYSNPTVTAVEDKIAKLEGAESAMLMSSGQGATSTALLGLLRAGDEVVCSSAIYGGTLHLLSDLLSHFGIRSRFVSVEDLRAPAAVLSNQTKLLWFESPINPTLRCVDIAAVAAACRERGVLSVIDNTFASPVNQSPIALGVDLVMHSATKYLNGHSDVTAGVLAVLMFYTRLNHLLWLFALIALLVPLDVEAGALWRPRAWLARVPIRSAAVIVASLLVGLGLFAWRTWYYTGVFSVFHGTQRELVATIQPTDTFWQAIGHLIEAVLVLVTVQDPPRFDPRAILVVGGIGVAVLALLRVPWCRNLPAGLALFCVAGLAGALVARGTAYVGRFSIHLMPVAVALAICFAANVVARLSTRTVSHA